MGRSASLSTLNVYSLAVITAFSASLVFPVVTCVPVMEGVGIPLIIGGEEANPGEFPWIVSIQTHVTEGVYIHACGGTIVNANRVITAAHCISENLSDDDIRIVAGAHWINRTEPSQQWRKPHRVVRHSAYGGDSLPFDIAVVEVSEPFNFNDRVQQLQMPPADIVASGTCQIAGWGQATSSIAIHPVLLKANIPVVSKQECSKVYAEIFDQETQMCAGRQEGGVDACNGDTGGALVCSDLGYKYFAGIASWGYGCAQPKMPGVYTDVAKFIAWIHSPHL